MKNLKKSIAVLLLVCSFSFVLVGCGNKAAKPYLGSWYGYKVCTDDGEIVFEDFSDLVKMELITEFASDGSYVLHYYVAGEEGDQYPKTGKFEMDGEKIVLIDDNGYGEIVNGELVLYFSDGAVKQYFRAN